MAAGRGFGLPAAAQHVAAAHHDFVEVADLEGGMVKARTVAARRQEDIVMVARARTAHEVAGIVGVFRQPEGQPADIEFRRRTGQRLGHAEHDMANADRPRVGRVAYRVVEPWRDIVDVDDRRCRSGISRRTHAKADGEAHRIAGVQRPVVIFADLAVARQLVADCPHGRCVIDPPDGFAQRRRRRIGTGRQRRVCSRPQRDPLVRRQTEGGAVASGVAPLESPLLEVTDARGDVGDAVDKFPRCA